MIFTKLTLKNFKSYNHTEINFKKGISVIVGENGAGKSTILEAINFALFKQYKTKKIDDLIRNGSNGDMSVELEFISDNLLYKILRERKNLSIKSTLYKKSKEKEAYIPICQGDKEVAHEIESILEMDGNLFMNAIYVRQGEIADLVDKKPAEKKHLIGKLLGIDSLEKAWKNIAPYISIYENKKAELSGKLDNEDNVNNEYEEISTLLESLKEEGLEHEKNIEELKEKLANIKQEKINLDREKEFYEENYSKLNSLEETQRSLDADKKQILEQLDNIRESEVEVTRLEKYVNKLPLYLDFEKSFQRIKQFKKEEALYLNILKKIAVQKDILIVESEKASTYILLKQDIEKLTEEKIELEKELAVYSKFKEDKQELIYKMQFKRNEIEKIFNRIKGILLSTGANEHKIDLAGDINSLKEIHETQIKIIKDKISKTESEVSKRKEDKIKYSQVIDTSSKPLDELEKIDNVCPLCKSVISQNMKKKLINSYLNQIDVSKNEIKLCDKYLKDYASTLEDLSKKLEDLQDLSSEFIAYDEKLVSITEDSNKLKELDDNLEACESNNSQLGKVVLSISNKENKCEELKDSFEKHDAAKAALNVLDEKEDIESKLEAIRSNIDLEVIKIKKCIANDIFLSEDINENELYNRLDDLKLKKEQYDKLNGFISNKVNIQSQYDSKKEEQDFVINEIELTLEKINSSSYNSEKHERITNKFKDLGADLIESENELAIIKGRSKELIQTVNKLKKQININKEYRKEYESINAYIKLLNNIRDIFSKNSIQRDLRNLSRPLIQKYSKDFFSQFNFNYSDLILNEDYDVSVIGPEGETSIDMVSGGEKIAIALALRLGITQALSRGNSETIMLDEPTIFLDASRRYELINLIKELTLLPQMIIVTHEAQLETAADNLIKVEKTNGVSKVV